VGNLVVFRRYSKEDGIYTYSASRGFDQHCMGKHCNGKQSLEDLKSFFGDFGSCNIGERIQMELATPEEQEAIVLARVAKMISR
jgi:hypothetical protein